jgi:hypothetical protein
MPLATRDLSRPLGLWQRWRIREEEGRGVDKIGREEG